MFNQDPGAWHGAYAGNEEPINKLPITPFIGSIDCTLDEKQRREMRERLIEIEGLIRRANTQGEKDFYHEEQVQINRQLFHINKGN
jgi:hypothetical protein